MQWEYEGGEDYVQIGKEVQVKNSLIAENMILNTEFQKSGKERR